MQLSRRFDGKNFMWDGQVYADKKQAREVSQGYGNSGFQTQIVTEEKQFYIFTRREIKEVVVEGKPS